VAGVGDERVLDLAPERRLLRPERGGVLADHERGAVPRPEPAV
jgi:hypothetical protein